MDDDKRFKILCLSGGGFLGLFSAVILGELERRVGESIGNYFDLIAGTSIGGIIALALGFDVPASKIVGQFERDGEQVFSDREPPSSTIEKIHDVLRFIKKPKYRQENLRATIEKLIEPNLILGQANHRVLVPAVNLTKGSPQVFKTPHLEKYQVDWERKAVDIALATSAAPTFFPIATIDDEMFVDGGTVANSPDLLALHEAEHFLDIRPEQVHILSIGTTTAAYSFSHNSGTELGASQWLSDNRIFSTLISAQQQMTDFLVRHKLSKRYVRVDAVQSKEQERALGLDVATKNAQRTIRGMATGALQQVLGDGSLEQFLERRVDPPHFYHGPRKG